TVEIPSPQAGTVTALKVAVGDSINTGDPLLELEATQDAVDESSEPSEPSEPVQEQEVQAPSGAVPVGDKEKTYKSTPQTAPLSGATSQLTIASDAAVYAGPAVRRLARKMGVELPQVTGTGIK